MAYRVEAATPEDIGDIAAIRIRALSDDDFWCTAKGSIPYEEELEWTITETLPRLGLGYELGACQIWKVVDEDGYAPFPAPTEQTRPLNSILQEDARMGGTSDPMLFERRRKCEAKDEYCISGAVQE